jgi:cation:H+ antiporter
VAVPLLYLALGLVLLYFGAEGLVRGSSSLALRLGLSPLLIGLTVVAFGTSSPEFVVSLKAGLAGQGDISVGNVVGSNICNIGLILGLSALITPIAISSQIIRVDTPVMIAVTVLGVFFLADGSLSRVEGGVLLGLLVVYILFSIRLARKSKNDAMAAEFDQEVKTSPRGMWFDLLMVVGGLLILVLGARLLVDGAVQIARAFGWSEALIGLTIVAVGTSLPELATSLLAALKKEADIAVGNIIGSNIFNLLGILGFTALLQPLNAAGLSSLDLGVMLAFALILWPFAYQQQRISRWEAIILMLGYAGYVGWLVRSA